MDDVFCLSQFFIKSFSNKFVDFFSFDFKFFRGLSQVMANFVRQNFFAGDLVDELFSKMREMLLDVVDDFWDLIETFGDGSLHNFDDFGILDFECFSKCFDLRTNGLREDIGAFNLREINHSFVNVVNYFIDLFLSFCHCFFDELVNFFNL